MGVKYFTDAGIECTPEECKLIESLNRLAKKWEKDGKRLWLYSASGVLTVMMHGDREDNPIPEMLPNAGTNPDNIITTISTIMMIGDASGKEGQFSDSDKKTAENFGCEYMDVDDFVDKYKG